MTRDHREDKRSGRLILVSQRVWGLVEGLVEAARDELSAAEPAGELTLKGFHRPVPAFRLRCS